MKSDALVVGPMTGYGATRMAEGVLQEIERLKALSERLRNMCQQHGLKYVEVSDDLPSTAANVIRHFIGPY